MTVRGGAPLKILVVALDNLGDAVMASSILAPLKRLFPESKVGIWVKDYAAELFDAHPSIDAVHACDPFWDRSPGKAKGALGPFLRAWNEIRKERYGAALILNAEWRRVLCCELAGIPRRVGYRGRKSGFFLSDAFDPPAEGAHFSDEHRGLLERFGGEPLAAEECLPRLVVAERDERWWRSWSEEKGLREGEFTVLHLFSGDEEKNWPLTAWAELIRRRPEDRFVALCGPGEKARLGPLRTELARPGVELLAAPSLGRLKAALSRARLVVGGDSGPEHAAAALGTNVLSLFGPTNPRRSGPRGPGKLKVLIRAPLRDLPVEEVLAAMAGFLL